MGWVWHQRAPASALASRRSISRDGSAAAGSTAAPTQNAVGSPTELPVASRPSFIPVRMRMSPMASTSNTAVRSEEHTSELQSQFHLVCRLLLEKKKKKEKCTLHKKKKKKKKKNK